MAQSRTAVNAKAASAESGDSISPSLVPGQSKNDLGGATPENERSTDNSTKLDAYKGAPGSVSSSPEGKIGSEVLPGGFGKHDGSNKGQSNEGPDTSIATGKDGLKSAPKGTQFAKAYEHAEVDSTAGQALDELAGDHDASDDFKARAKVIFESALNQKLQLEVERLEEEFSHRFENEITEIAEKVEGFLNYTSGQWLEENKLVVENGIRNELSESFMQGLRGLFEDHYVTLPDEKYDIFESMVAKLDDMEDKLNEQIESNVNLVSQMSGYTRQSVLADVSWDLPETGKDKLAGLAESVEFESENSFRQKLEILKESFVGGQETTEQQSEYLEESAEVLQPTMEEGMTSSMAAYSRALSRTIK